MQPLIIASGLPKPIYRIRLLANCWLRLLHGNNGHSVYNTHWVINSHFYLGKYIPMDMDILVHQRYYQMHKLAIQ